MIVVADSSPLNYLALIESLDLLRRLYGRIVVPQQVMLELIDPAAPYEVRKWASALPGWVDVRSLPPSNDPSLSHLDPGEQSAILLAQLEAGALLLIDDAAGRLEASRRGILTTGTRRPSRGGSEGSRGSALCSHSAARDKFPRLNHTRGRSSR